MGKVADLNEKRYEDAIRKVVSGLDGKDQSKALQVLSSERARDIYELLREDRIPGNTITKVMKHSLSNISRGKGLTVGSYASGVAEELAHMERYRDTVEDMREEGYIDEREYQRVTSKLNYQIKESSKDLRRGLSNLETKIAAAICGISGGALIVLSGAQITGNAVGNVDANTSGFIAGFLLLVMYFVLFSRSFKK